MGLLDCPRDSIYVPKVKVKRYFLKEPNLDADCIKLILNALNPKRRTNSALLGTGLWVSEAIAAEHFRILRLLFFPFSN